MIHYIIQVIAFQLLFIVVYDFFLKKETFFNWNRVYLLMTSVLSFVIPLIKLEQFKEVIPQTYVIALPEIIVGANVQDNVADPGFKLTALQLLFIIGSIISLLIFIYKLYRIYSLKSNNNKVRYSDYTTVIIKDSTSAFSFFKNIFLGDRVLEKEHQHIIDHELVHVKQNHSLDLVFFELLKVVMWFNPLIYIYQNRISELHEFIADAKIIKKNKQKHYQHLLSEVFKTENISFINQFFNSSLIKKRIIMLQKSKSKNIWQLKYLLLIPLVLTMLVYSSCENESQELRFEEASQEQESEENLQAIQLAKELQSIKDLTPREKEELYAKMLKFIESGKIVGTKTEITTNKNGDFIEGVDIPFAVVDKVPVFPGCEDAADPRACFNQKMQEHIRENFQYPEEAMQKGIQGRVAVLFTIDENGNITKIKKRGTDKSLEAEAVRIIEKLPKMEPGEHKGQGVRVPFSIPINFRLQ
ncbi:TonB family protein [Flavobacteriaceae bacterium R38]|nr:TonB family protein [Flavobacteriaceae bacterium R38]